MIVQFILIRKCSAFFEIGFNLHECSFVPWFRIYRCCTAIQLFILWAISETLYLFSQLLSACLDLHNCMHFFSYSCERYWGGGIFDLTPPGTFISASLTWPSKKCLILLSTWHFWPLPPSNWTIKWDQSERLNVHRKIILWLIESLQLHFIILIRVSV